MFAYAISTEKDLSVELSGKVVWKRQKLKSVCVGFGGVNVNMTSFQFYNDVVL